MNVTRYRKYINSKNIKLIILKYCKEIWFNFIYIYNNFILKLNIWTFFSVIPKENFNKLNNIKHKLNIKYICSYYDFLKFFDIFFINLLIIFWLISNHIFDNVFWNSNLLYFNILLDFYLNKIDVSILITILKTYKTIKNKLIIIILFFYKKFLNNFIYIYMYLI